MGEKLVIGPINKGLRSDRTPFVIDNDSFPTLINAYQWRGRVKRKRGTSLLGRLQRYIGSTDGSGNATITIFPAPTNGQGDSFQVGTDIFNDPGGTGTITLITNSSGSATLVRSTGVLTITGSQISTPVVYFPSLPVMGLEDFVIDTSNFPASIGFDTTYSYNISTTFPYPITDVSFYNNPAASAALPNYVPKTTWTPTNWSGQNYQQFWTTNYQGALWATNGVQVPFVGVSTNIGMQFKPIVTVDNIAAGPPYTADLTIIAHGLVVGDFIFVNEVATTTGINWQTGYVTKIVSANKVNVTFPNATITTNGSGGIAQYLTSQANPAKDCLRWYNGSPVDGNIPPNFVNGSGWVNFMPPLSQAAFSISDLPQAIYYLVGARMILPFHDRLLFIGPVVQSQTSGVANTPVYLDDTVVYSQSGTPYYTCSYTNAPSSTVDTPTSDQNVYSPILVPVNQTATSPAYFADQTGFGGFVATSLSEPINTTSINEDVLIFGFRNRQMRFTFTGNDIVPFQFFIINSELGSSSTFSAINMDKGVLTRGSRGYVMTSQVEASRFDTEIPDEVFEVRSINNGNERFTSARDFVNEWVYFTYPANNVSYIFPNQTLFFNYRDNSFAIFNETYTTYGQFRRKSGFTWGTVGQYFPTWGQWNVPWNAGSSSPLNPLVIAGNQQGFVIFREDSTTGEATSLYITNITTTGLGATQITAINHCLNNGDYIIISGVLGTSGPQINGNIYTVSNAATNTFLINPLIEGLGTYLGGGLITRMYVPQIQTKQFPIAWDMARKTRIGPQQYLLSTTDDAQISLLIYLSQNGESAYNTGMIVPEPGSVNNSLIYSNILFTCPEGTNIGLTPANVNLQTPTAVQQEQIWHRMNTSLIGDTVQFGFTMSDAQMRAVDANNMPVNAFEEIELHSIVVDIQPSQLLA